MGNKLITVPDHATALARLDETQMGPAMRALRNDRQRLFVIILVQTGCSTADAAKHAGYSASSQNVLASKGWQLAHDERIQAALREEGLKALRASSVAGITILSEIARNPNEAARDRISAVKEIMSRGGFGAVSEHTLNVVHRSEQEVDAELMAVAKELGMSDEATAKLLGRPVVRKREATDITDAVIVEDAPQPLADEPAPLAKEEGHITNENPLSSPATGEMQDEPEDISDLF